jgi:chromosome segregation ATPase
MRLIRRYPNRKLYDVQSSCYVSLKTLREMILGGAEIRVESSTDGKDLTRITLARLKLAEAEQTVRNLPEIVVGHLGQGLDGMTRRLQSLESGIATFRGSTISPVARMEEVAEKLERLQDSIGALNERLDQLENRHRDEE